MSRADQETLLLMVHEMQLRTSGDPLLSFELHSKQKPFVASVLENRRAENWFLAANRAGKSDAGAYTGAHLARFGDQSDNVRSVGAKDSSVQVRDRSTSGWVVALDFPLGRDVIQPKYFDNGFGSESDHDPFIPDREIAEWRSGDQVLRLKNGSIIGFKSAESGRKKFQGADKDWIHFDEEPPKSVFDEAVIRVGSRPLKIFGTCTLLPPEGTVGGVTWVYQDIVKPWQKGEGDHIGIFQSSIYDNPHIPRGEIARLEARYPPGSISRRIRLNGELLPGLSGSRAYTGFISSLHALDPGEILPRKPLAWIWDFNISPMVSLIGQRQQGIFKVFKEIVLEEASIPEMCAEFRMRFPHHRAEIHVYGDATGKGRSTHDKLSSYQIILNEMSNYNAPVSLRVPESNPSVTNRINAVNRAMRNENGEIWVEVHPDCEELISDFEGVLLDGKGGIKKTWDSKDPYHRRTHTSDAFGYWVWFEEPVRAQEKEEDTRRPKINIKPSRYGFGRGKAASGRVYG